MGDLPFLDDYEMGELFFLETNNLTLPSNPPSVSFGLANIACVSRLLLAFSKRLLSVYENGRE